MTSAATAVAHLHSAWPPHISSALNSLTSASPVCTPGGAAERRTDAGELVAESRNESWSIFSDRSGCPGTVRREHHDRLAIRAKSLLAVIFLVGRISSLLHNAPLGRDSSD